jgi:hypothetical protein
MLFLLPSDGEIGRPYVTGGVALRVIYVVDTLAVVS